jgi:hypothetical protein
MDEKRAIQLCVKHRDPVGFEFLVHKYRREAFFHAFALLGNLLLKETKVKRIIARALGAKHAQVLEKLGPDLFVLPTRDMA